MDAPGNAADEDELHAIRFELAENPDRIERHDRIRHHPLFDFST